MKKIKKKIQKKLKIKKMMKKAKMMMKEENQEKNKYDYKIICQVIKCNGLDPSICKLHPERCGIVKNILSDDGQNLRMKYGFVKSKQE